MVGLLCTCMRQNVPKGDIVLISEMPHPLSGSIDIERGTTLAFHAYSIVCGRPKALRDQIYAPSSPTFRATERTHSQD